MLMRNTFLSFRTKSSFVQRELFKKQSSFPSFNSTLNVPFLSRRFGFGSPSKCNFANPQLVFHRSYTSETTIAKLKQELNYLNTNANELLKLSTLSTREDQVSFHGKISQNLNESFKHIIQILDVNSLNDNQREAIQKDQLSSLLDSNTVLKGLIMQILHLSKKVIPPSQLHKHDHHHHHEHHHHGHSKPQPKKENLEEKLKFLLKMLNETTTSLHVSYESLLRVANPGEETEVEELHVTPVSIITGFLGSGKTTLVNYILRENHGKKIAIIENEFGEIGIDDSLIQKSRYQAEEEILEMNNGCVCCTVRGDLIRILGKLLSSNKKFDHIIIETTGLAHTAPVAQTFFTVPELANQLRIDGIITVVDAKYIIQHLDETKPKGVDNEAVEQIAFADRILLNKTDLVSEDQLKVVTQRIRSINKYANVVRTQHSQIDLNKILDIRAFDVERALELEPHMLEESHHHHHDKTVTSVGIELSGEMDFQKVSSWLERMLQEKGADIYRMKGVLAVKDMKEKFVFQGVHMTFTGEPLSEWGINEQKINKLVFIGKNLNREELISNFKECIAK